MNKNNNYPTWRAIAWLLLFRLAIAAGLILLFWPIAATPLSPFAQPTLLWSMVLIYGFMILLSGLPLYAQWPEPEQQVQLAVCIDIVCLTIIMYLAGGIGTGLGLLIAIVVTGGALLLEGKLALLFASFATIGVIAQQICALLFQPAPSGSLTQAGLLGATYFTVAILAHVLFRRLRETEQLAAKRQVDIDDLSKLNDHVIQSMDMGIVVLDREHNIRLTNASANELLNLTPSRKRLALRDVVRPLDDWMTQQTHRSAAFMESTMLKIGEQEISASGQLIGDASSASGTLIFLQSNRQLVREAQQIKLASLGRLTASIAHNIRNPLSAVSHAAQLLAESPDLDAGDKHLIEIIHRNTNRLNETVSSILQLSRSNTTETRSIDLVIWLTEFCADFRDANQLLPSVISVKTSETTLPANVDTRHLHQILANLCDNALVHASVDAKIPCIDIIASRAGEDADNIVVEVVDDGHGIDAETASEIFDPFFTTSSSGTGLGLYIARELAQANGIQIEYVERRHSGCCFRLRFPR